MIVTLSAAARLVECEVTKNIYCYKFYIIQSYLLSVGNGMLKDHAMKIRNTYCLNNQKFPVLDVAFPMSRSTGLITALPQALYFDIDYREDIFIASLFGVLTHNGYYTTVEYYCAFTAKSGNFGLAEELYEHIEKQALRHSPFRNNILLIMGKDFSIDMANKIQIRKAPPTTMENIYMPADSKFHIRRFIHAVHTWDEYKKPLRYLFNGAPGTGKTQIINAIMNATHGKVTTIVIDGTDIDLEEAIRFCHNFSPCLLVLDDVDFFAGTREKNFRVGQLATFLHMLDGIFSEPVFLLASTNDKQLVDEAASRPGRFDLIIDVSFLKAENYLQLITRETDDENILSLFTPELLDFFSEKKVTGAFIVNLVKQAISIKNMEGEIRSSHLYDLVEYSHSGFYSQNDASLKKVVGF